VNQTIRMKVSAGAADVELYWPDSVEPAPW